MARRHEGTNRLSLVDKQEYHTTAQPNASSPEAQTTLDPVPNDSSAAAKFAVKEEISDSDSKMTQDLQSVIKFAFKLVAFAS